MDDTSSTSSDERIKSKIRMRRERQAQKYTVAILAQAILDQVLGLLCDAP